MERVPEHSLSFMQAMSGGKSFQIGNYQFFYADDWLMAIGYPLQGTYQEEEFINALAEAQKSCGASQCYAIGSKLPVFLEKHTVSRDRYYLLESGAGMPSRLKNPLKKAAERLKITESANFSAEHRKLWNEFLDFQGSGGNMSARVRELYLRTPVALAHCNGTLRLLDAWTEEGQLTASLLLDYGPRHFTSYILGAHSRRNMIPHAMDLLFWNMILNASNAGKRYIHLGLGVNEGILRFKRKWGAKAYFPYQMAAWDIVEKTSPQHFQDNTNLVRDLTFAILKSSDKSARQLLEETSASSPFAMIWEVEKNSRISWVSGTAHFFCRSFENSFRKLYKNVQTVIFEGPLDNGFMEQVEAAGKILPPGKIPIYDGLSQEEIQRLEKIVNGPRGLFSGRKTKINRLDIPHLLRTGNYWYTFFTLWTKFLETRGWKESVDMEAWRLASGLNMKIVAMESLEEQLESLGSLPRERVINFMRNCASWKTFAERNRKAYLSGDLERMMGTSAEFPTRTEHVVGRRDQRFRERMRPWLEEGGCAVFVGCAHMVNLRHMLKADGFHVRQKPFGLWPKIHLKWRNLKRPDEMVKW